MTRTLIGFRFTVENSQDERGKESNNAQADSDSTVPVQEEEEGSGRPIIGQSDNRLINKAHHQLGITNHVPLLSLHWPISS